MRKCMPKPLITAGYTGVALRRPPRCAARLQNAPRRAGASHCNVAMTVPVSNSSSVRPSASRRSADRVARYLLQTRQVLLPIDSDRGLAVRAGYFKRNDPHRAAFLEQGG